MATSLSLEDKVKRLIYKNQMSYKFYVGNPDEYQKDIMEDRQTILKEVIHNDLTELFSIIDTANKDASLPRRSILFLLLAQIMNTEEINQKSELKSKITAKVFEISQHDEDFFTFIKYYTLLRTQGTPKNKMPSSVEKVVRKFYTSKSPMELAQSVAKHNKIYKWAHKDLIKLVHVKSDTPLKNVVINYILTRKVSEKATEEELKVLDIMRKSDELRKTNESVNAIPILASHKLTIDQVCPSLHQNGEVWSAAIQNMSIQQILPCLGKLYKLNLLKANSTVSNHLTQLFTNSEKVKVSGVHPIEVFSYMKKLEKGGKPMDIKLLNHLQNVKKLSEADLKKAQTRNEAKCIHILNTLMKCFNLACNNVESTNKRYLVTIDVIPEARKSICIGNKVLTLLEAAVAYAVILLRVEKEVSIATYKNDRIELLSVEKDISFSNLLEKVKKQTSTYSMQYSGVEWALSENRPIDVFVNFLDNGHMGKIPKDKEQSMTKTRSALIAKYKSKVNLDNAKYITFAPVKKYMPAWADAPPNVLEILGFDVTACKVAECFAKGAFC